MTASTGFRPQPNLSLTSSSSGLTERASAWPVPGARGSRRWPVSTARRPAPTATPVTPGSSTGGRWSVLHLFAAFCQVVIGNYSSTNKWRGAYLTVAWLHRAWDLLQPLFWRAVFYGGPAAGLLLGEHAITRKLSISSAWVQASAITLI